jgi:hypothetical protein
MWPATPYLVSRWLASFHSHHQPSSLLMANPAHRNLVDVEDLTSGTHFYFERTREMTVQKLRVLIKERGDAPAHSIVARAKIDSTPHQSPRFIS